MVIKVFFTVLVLCTAAVVAVGLAIHFRVKRHLREQPAPNPAPEGGALEEPIAAQVHLENVGSGNARPNGDAAVEDKRP
ncbi:MAG: hypothetical protein ACLPPV_09090 [Candidatus Korobacteraceae bacterium]